MSKRPSRTPQFVQILFDLDTWRSGGATFKDRLVSALHATHAEALWHAGRVPDPGDRHLIINSAGGQRTLKSYTEIQKNPKRRDAYWRWVARANETSDLPWTRVLDGFLARSGPP